MYVPPPALHESERVVGKGEKLLQAVVGMENWRLGRAEA